MNKALASTKDRVVIILRRPVMFGWALLGYLVFVGGMGLLMERVIDISAQQTEAADQNQDEEIYEAQFRAYEIQVIGYGDCLSIVKGREDHRLQWSDFYTELGAELGESPRTVALLERLRLRLDENLPSLDPAETCTEPGPAPVPPEGTDAQPLPVPSTEPND